MKSLSVAGRTSAMNDTDRLIDNARIELLLTVAKHRSFKAAAATLGIAQPTVSQRIARIETLAGCPLFRRTRHGVELTPAGEAVVKYGQAVFGLASDLRRRLDQIITPIKINIGMSEDFCRTALPSVLWLFMHDHPQVDVRIISGTYDTLTSAVEKKSVDFAIMRRYSRYPDITVLWTDALVWVGSPRLPLPIMDPVPLVVPMLPNPARDAPMDALRRVGRSWDVKFESVGIAGIEAALEAGIGICAGPRQMRLHGVVALGRHSSLPDLPDVEFVMVGLGADATPLVLAAAQVLMKAAQSDFRLVGPTGMGGQLKENQP